MKVKIQKYIVPLVVLFIVLFADYGSAITVEPSQGVENRVTTRFLYKTWAEVIVPGHAVFESGASSGFQTLPLYLLGEHYHTSFLYKKRTGIDVYISAKYRETTRDCITGEVVSTREYWDETPVNLITYGGSRQFNAEVGTTFSYTAQVQGTYKAFQMQIGVSYSSSPTCYTYVDGQIIVMEYRRLGGIHVEYGGRYIFTAMLPLRISNYEANRWYAGIISYSDDYDYQITTQILGFKIRAHYTYLANVVHNTYDLVLGDNQNVDYGDVDIDLIKLRPGYVAT